jgi:hypothetical protein
VFLGRGLCIVFGQPAALSEQDRRDVEIDLVVDQRAVAAAAQVRL